MRLLFVIDPPQSLNPRKDSTIALMRAAAARGDEVHVAGIADLSILENAARVQAQRLEIHPQEADGADAASWMTVTEQADMLATNFDAVFMRKEPPVDEDFIMATRLLDIIARQTPVINHPRALREQNEKLAILNFPDLIPPTWVGADAAAAAAFRRRHRRVVLKPLNGMGGQGVYASPEEDPNFKAVFELLSDNGRRLIMAQAYLPAAREGDCRVFAVNGRGLPLMLARLPRGEDHRGNMAAGGIPEARPIDAAAQKIADAVAPALAAQGVLFAGLDVIGGRLIEINITCPTGLCEVHAQTGENIAAAVLQETCAV